jgi:two-component system LytT family sensor kinase
MINNYIARQIRRKNRGVYFKKGKWLFHVFFLMLIGFITVVKPYGENIKALNLGKSLASLCTLLPFIAFFYFYCLYLIPVCFKGNQRKKFWLLLLLCLLVFPMVDVMIQAGFMNYLPSLSGQKSKSWFLIIFETYKNFLSNFTGFTSMLYIMELMEEIRTSKEISLNRSQLATAEINMLKTHMNPDFMIRSLDGIIHLSEDKSTETPEAVIYFSDVLRYRLYRSMNKLVPLSEELQQLGNLFRFQNAIPGQEQTCSLETEGDTATKYIIPLVLINIAEPLLEAFSRQPGWSVLFYLLVEEEEMQVAIEMTYDSDMVPDTVLETIQYDLKRLMGTDVIFTAEKAQNAYSIRTCIPLRINSTVS